MEKQCWFRGVEHKRTKYWFHKFSILTGFVAVLFFFLIIKMIRTVMIPESSQTLDDL